MSLLKDPKVKPLTAFDVLIIDDEPDVIEILRDYCLKMKYFRNVVVAKDGVDASYKLSNQKFRLILLDLKIPKKSGIDVLKLLNTTSNETSDVVIVSGIVGPTETQLLLKNGIRHILIKPFHEDDFLKKVKAVLNIS